MTPASVPSAIFTPPSSAILNELCIRGAIASALAAIGGGRRPAVASDSTVNPASSVGTSQVPCCFISVTASASRIDPCSIDVTPARTAALIPAVPCACAATRRSSCVAVSTIARISSSLYCCTPAESVRDSTPPVAQILMTSAPYLTAYRTALRTSSTPSATPTSAPPSCPPPSANGWSPFVPSQCPPRIPNEIPAAT